MLGAPIIELHLFYRESKRFHCIILSNDSTQVDEAYKRGDIVTARSASEKARKWSYAGVLCGIMDFVVTIAVWLIILYAFWKIQE